MKRSIVDFSAKEIEAELTKARSGHNGVNDSIQILFAPNRINEQNMSQAASVYSRLNPTGYDTVVIVEECKDVANQKLSMPSNETHQTPFGEVPVNDYLRNEFCDEDDDFFINDSEFHQNLCLFQQLMMLQVSLEDFSVLNLQISDGDEHIIKELVSAINELIGLRKVLLVFCCSMNSYSREEFEDMQKMIETAAYSGLLNLLNRDADRIDGISAFITGLFVTFKWGAKIHFLNDDEAVPTLTAYAERERVFY